MLFAKTAVDYTEHTSTNMRAQGCLAERRRKTELYPKKTCRNVTKFNESQTSAPSEDTVAKTTKTMMKTTKGVKRTKRAPRASA